MAIRVSEAPPLQKLIQRYLNGDNQACQQLISSSEYQQRVEKIARKQTRGQPLSWEDAAQTAHEKVFQALQEKRFHPEKGYFHHWAATVAKFAIIDWVRKEQQRTLKSLDQNIPGTDIPLSETIADEFNLLDTVERTDLVFRVQEAIAIINQRYPHRNYGKLWQGKVEGKTQTQLATDLNITQSAISKRWKELTAHIAQELGLLPDVDNTQATRSKPEQKKRLTRSNLNW
jgi:RNA polymerase sporulation-specific sigma factor